ncbi:putative RDD family membrane protein YckC/Tfp pilus assembly protein PilE [Elusimicrobium posterum]|uniref:RDD family protein n=1 Tax=Elusimicrobium posterum TaxID=3116653 RepID=UPI003C77B754
MYAGFWRRFLAVIIDTFFVLFVLAAIAAAAVYAQHNLPAYSEYIEVQGAFPLLILSFALLYFPLMEASPLQATLGKKMLGIKVTNKSGDPASFYRTFFRHIFKYISSILMLGYLITPFTSKKQALHDILSGSLVVDEHYDPLMPGAPYTVKGFKLFFIFCFVVFLLGSLSLFALPSYKKSVELSRAAEAATVIKHFSDAQERYRLDTGRYALTLYSLDVEAPGVYEDNNIIHKNFKYSLYTARGGQKFSLIAQPQKRPGGYIILNESDALSIRCVVEEENDISKYVCGRINRYAK